MRQMCKMHWDTQRCKYKLSGSTHYILGVQIFFSEELRFECLLNINKFCHLDSSSDKKKDILHRGPSKT